MNADGTLGREEMKKVGKLNPYLRDKCGVPFPKAFPMAMVIIENWDGIKNIVEQEDRRMIKVGLIVLLIIAAIIFFGAILGVCTDDEYYEEDAFDYDAWEERDK